MSKQSYFDPALHGQTDSERRTRLAMMRAIHKLVALGIKSDWDPVQGPWGGPYVVIDAVYNASRRPE